MSTQQLTREEIARVFAMYHGCLIHNDPDTYEDCNGYSIDKIESFGIKYGKLLLTPLSRISDEDAIEVATIIWGEPKDWSMTLLKQVLVDLYRKNSATLTLKSSVFINQYLISKGYAVPLFFAPNHPCNGLNAIELGIAIDNLQTK